MGMCVERDRAHLRSGVHYCRRLLVAAPAHHGVVMAVSVRWPAVVVRLVVRLAEHI